MCLGAGGRAEEEGEMRDVSCAAVGSGSDKATDDVSDGGTGDFRDEAAGDLLDEAEGLAALAFAFPLPFALGATEAEGKDLLGCCLP